MQSASPDEPSHDELLAFQTKMEAALDVATRGCEPWCRRPCSQLNGGSEAILAGCGGCKGSLYACAPGHSGWPGHPSWPGHPPLPCERRDPPERDVLAAYHSSHAAVIERYYDRYTICYTDTHGKLIQGYRHSSSDADEVRLISMQTRIEDGMRVLDNGCGVGGVMHELVALFPSAVIDGVTISGVQAKMAQARMDLLGCTSCRVLHADMAAPLPDSMAAQYDRVLFVESLGYASCSGSARGAWHALRPGGMVFVKDVCFHEMTDEGAAAISRLWLYMPRTAAEIKRCFEAVGFQKLDLTVGSEDMTAGANAPGAGLTNSDHLNNAFQETIASFWGDKYEDIKAEAKRLEGAKYRTEVSCSFLFQKRTEEEEATRTADRVEL